MGTERCEPCHVGDHAQCGGADESCGCNCWMDKIKVTVKFCPRCRYQPYHGATIRSLCCGLDFVTRTFTAGGAAEFRYPNSNIEVGHSLGGVWKRDSRTPTPEGRFGDFVHFPSQEALDRYTEFREYVRERPWSRSWAIEQYHG